MAYRKVYEIVGWTYEADTHCNECAVKRFGTDLDSPNCTDNEGNKVLAIFLDSINSEDPICCGDCLSPID